MHLLPSLVVLAAPVDAGVPPPPAPRPLTFAYDTHQPLEVKDTVVAETPGATIHDLTCASADQQRVGAFLLVPEGKGPFVPIVFGHCARRTRDGVIPLVVLGLT